MSGVDVLEVMDEYVKSCAHCDGKGQHPVGEPYCDNGPTIDLEACAECAEIRQARAAVAELIEADQQCDEAEAEFAKYPGSGSALWLKNAKERRLAALSRVTGGAA